MAAGNDNGGDDPAFVIDVFGWLAEHDVAFVAFWDFQNSTIDGGHNPRTAQALRQALTGFGTGSSG